MPQKLELDNTPIYFPLDMVLNLTSPKMANSFELLTGPIETVQQRYEILSDIVTEHNGKVYNSRSHIIANNSMHLIVYYEVPLGQRDEVKQKFNNKSVYILDS